MKFSAFTLIELLVVIVILGILATISTAAFLGYQDRARIAAKLAELRIGINELLVLRIDYENGDITASELMEKDLAVVDKAISIGRLQTDQTLRDITGSTCSDCICRGDTFQNVNSGSALACEIRWNNILSVIRTTTDIDLGFMETDPWGSPYLVDENESENAGDYCRRDNLFSEGPDRNHNVGAGNLATGDGFTIEMSFYNVSRCGL